MLVTLRPLCKIFLAALGADPELLASDTGQIFKKNFWPQNCVFWSSLDTDIYMIRQFRIYFNFLQFFVSTRGPLQGLRLTRNCACCGALNTALSRVFFGGGTLPVRSLLSWAVRSTASLNVESHRPSRRGNEKRFVIR